MDEILQLWNLIPPQYQHYVTLALAAIGAARIVFKVVFTALGDFVKKTPSPADDALLDRMLQSNTYAGVAFLFDYLLSIKLPTVDPNKEPKK